MRTLSIQLHPNRIESGDTERLVETLQRAASGASLRAIAQDRGDDDGPYINLSFAAPDHVAAWSQLRAVYEDADVGTQLASASIVVCEGADGWNDYLLLHHFDPAEKLDDVRSR
jgi:hypothetical protein